MAETISDIIARLRREIMPLNAFKSMHTNDGEEVLPASIRSAFQDNIFPLGAVHEFITDTAENRAASAGFICGTVSSLMKNGAIMIWVGSGLSIFPPALKAFGILPQQVIFIDLKKEKEVLWTIEEALKCEGLAAVVGEVKDLNFTASRRLQLAVEQSHVSGFMIRNNMGNLNTTACVTRWKITSLPSVLIDEMPGVGFPRWNVELLKVRNGKPGTWQIEFVEGRFRAVYKTFSIPQIQKKKTG